ncbi:MAG: XdhC family protein [Ignavibacteriales bacterium]|nr:XdhC family protein [Ignavibacteriales bacterium]
MKELGFWQFVSDQLQMQHPVMLVAVVDYEKGSPGKTGFKMAVTAGETHGTIGGGVMEFNLIQQSREFLSAQKGLRHIKKLVHNPNTTVGEPSGLICAGSQTITVISLTLHDIETVINILSALKWYAPSNLALSNNGLAFHMGKQPVHNQFSWVKEQEWMYRENIGSEFTVYIIGGGHVGLATARVLQTLDVNVVLIDDRVDAPAMKDPSLFVRKIVASYETIGQHVEEGDASFIVTVTSALQSDRMALQSILGKKFGYIGLMGTQAKISRILNSFSPSEKKSFDGIHAPIGIDIGSKTVEEIAVSIAADVIKEKNKNIDY